MFIHKHNEIGIRYIYNNKMCWINKILSGARQLASAVIPE